MDQQRHLPRQHALQRVGVGAGEQRFPAAIGEAGGVAGIGLRLEQRVAEHRHRRRAAATRRPRAAFAPFHELEGARAGERVHVVAKVDDRALPGKDRSAIVRGDDRAGDAVGAVDRDRRGARIDRRGDVEPGIEHAVTRGSIVGGRHAVDLDDAQPGKAGDDAGRDETPAGIDRRATRRRSAAPGRDDAPATDDDGAALDRGRSVAQHEFRVGDGHVLRGGRHCGGTGKQRGEEQALHFTSPSPGWPSSKSDTGRIRGSSASNSSAPSIQTFSGRV